MSGTLFSKNPCLLRAYAVLHRVELLRQENVISPLPSDSEASSSYRSSVDQPSLAGDASVSGSASLSEAAGSVCEGYHTDINGLFTAVNCGRKERKATNGSSGVNIEQWDEVVTRFGPFACEEQALEDAAEGMRAKLYRKGRERPEESAASSATELLSLCTVSPGSRSISASPRKSNTGTGKGDVVALADKNPRCRYINTAGVETLDDNTDGKPLSFVGRSSFHVDDGSASSNLPCEPQQSLKAPTEDVDCGIAATSPTAALVSSYKQLEEFHRRSMQNEDAGVGCREELVHSADTVSLNVGLSRSGAEDISVGHAAKGATPVGNAADSNGSGEFIKPEMTALAAEFMTLDPKQLCEKLRSIEGCHGENAAHYRVWFALSALMNTDSVIQHVVIPLLLEMLLQQVSSSPCALDEENTMAFKILCAIAGLGERAACALPALLRLIDSKVGCLKLVAFAVRAVGGHKGMQELCNLARSGCYGGENSGRRNADAWTAVIYGISAMPQPVQGYTAVLCLPAAGCSNSVDNNAEPAVSFFQVPGLGRHEKHVDEHTLDVGSCLQNPPLYTPTHIVIDADLARRKLLHFISSSPLLFGAKSHLPSSVILQDFVRVVNSTWNQRLQGQLPVAVGLELEHCGCETNTIQYYLPYSYDPYYIGHDDDLFCIEETLVSVLLERFAPSAVLEQTLQSLGVLPGFATVHVAAPVLDFVTQFTQRFSKQQEECANKGFVCASQEAVVVAGLLVAGRLAHNPKTPRVVVDATCDFLLQNVGSPYWRVRDAACAGLGELGVVSNRADSVVQVVTNCLKNSEVNAETAAWTLARTGLQGVGTLLDFITGKRVADVVSTDPHDASGTDPLPTAARVACVRALPKADVLAVPSNGVSKVGCVREDVLRRLGVFIAMNDGEEDLVLECVYTLAELLQMGSTDSCNSGVPRSEEASACRLTDEPGEVFEVFKTLIEEADLPCSVLKALFFSLCAFGGQHGELYSSRTSIQHPDATFRAAAVFGLRACGGRAIRTIAFALNDDCISVRVEAFETVDAIGIGEVMSVLQQRPRSHTRQVAAALRDSLLRDVSRGVERRTANELYAVLTRGQHLL